MTPTHRFDPRGGVRPPDTVIEMRFRQHERYIRRVIEIDRDTPRSHRFPLMSPLRRTRTRHQLQMDKENKLLMTGANKDSLNAMPGFTYGGSTGNILLPQ